MKILIIVENLPVPFDRRVWQEATTLRENGHDVSIISPAMKIYTASYEIIDGIHIYRHPLPIEGNGVLGYLSEYGLALVFQFILALKIYVTRGFDVIHACNPPDNIFIVAAFFKAFCNCRFVFDHHDINPELYLVKFGKKDIFYQLMLLWEKWTFRLADLSIATNESYRKIAIQRGGMAPEKVFVVRSGPDLSRVKKAPPNPKWKKDKAHLVGYVGVMGAQEGLDYLLYGIDYLVHELKREDIHFVLAGDGTELPKIKQLSHDLGVSAYVTFTGRVPDRTLMEILSTADICVNPDAVNEMNDKSTMNKIMEYMALGKPIVQFNMTEGRYSAGDASLYASPNDPVSLMENILELINDTDKATRMGEIGRRRVISKLQWHHEKANLIKAYNLL